MFDYTDTLMLMKRYDNLIIPQIPEILTQYLSYHEEHLLLLLDKKWKINRVLEHIYQNFSQNIEITEAYILILLLEYFGLGE